MSTVSRSDIQYSEILARLEVKARPGALEGMARYGINTENAYGVAVPDIRTLAKEIGRDHALARELWASGIHECLLLASMVDDPKQVTEAQMEEWVRDFHSWEVCDQCCGNLFDKTPFAYDKAAEWSAREEEFVRRAGFALVAALAVHDKKAEDERFLAFLPLIKERADDDRHYVKRAVNWALRQVGKRNRALNQAAIATARELALMDSPAGRWNASDALRELTSEAVQSRLKG